MLDRIVEDATRESDQEGLDRVVFTEEQASRHDQLTRLLPLVSHSETKRRELVLALYPFVDPVTRSLARPR